ncbi:purine nucleosidase/ribosylpyrimidine nucleosidase [Saccharopolyspora antimicrobica]|uniref:Purine nucleosidase/ribosylpyrimidine nucleosidase n=1 Tax=Saccharopolyspora antimicrobica TaxID=455193 RepID=A0A1I4TTA0_9PSEU|nr:nucleoside hydrolase [Saccharopolyspora antimicrobica]RKT88540.1 purine nucleosidase/ribosylpyrimidine nucleosidase [Saccharopolyspora antimicrobica]SFM79810.1 purine nucleosidase/ribosylpyrimidine nucleosidase [Saccharopolyspora antimicrobica]
MGRKIILDVDTGTDDAVAIMFAALHPELDLLGITTVNGNVALANTTDNTLRVLDWIGRPDIPVHPGVPHPIARFGFPGGRHFEQDDENDPHGTELPIPAPTTAARDTGAIEYLVETLRATTEPITLVAVGPLSNIATALAVDPSVAGAVDELVVMGGGHAVTNVSASAEFNIWADPEAASVVFSAGFARRTLVTLDATHRALIPQRTCEALDALGTPAGTAAARFITRRIGAYEHTAVGAAPVHDVVCTAYLVAPEVISTQHLPVAVETASPLTVGRTVIDTRPGTELVPNAHIALDANADLLNELLLSTFARDVTS